VENAPSRYQAGQASTSPVPSSALPSLGVARRELKNGLHILVHSDYSAPVASVQYWCATGSIHEGRWLGAGISHLLEHLLFKGTPTRGNSQMAQEIQALGGHLNAYTSFDRTVYHVDLPSENTLPALEILTDAVLHSVIPPEEFEKEKDVIRREFAMGEDNPDRQLSHLLFRTAFLHHPYRFPVIGHLDLFNLLTRDDVLAYYRERYAPQNLTLIVCGAVEPEPIFERAETLFQNETRRPLPDVVIPAEPFQQSRRQACLPFPTEVSRMAFTYQIPGIEHEDIPALEMLAMVAGGSRSSRLHQACVEKLGLAEEISAFSFSSAGVGCWGVDARCAPEKQEALAVQIRHELERLRQAPPESEELQRARRLALLHHIHSLKTMSGKAASLGRGWLLSQDPAFSENFLARLQAVTQDQVWRAAQRYLDFRRETAIEVVPQASATPAPSAKKMPSETALRLRPLPNSLRTLSLSSSRLPLVGLRAVFPGGLPAEKPDLAGIGLLSANLLIKGTRKRTAEELAREIEQIGGSVGADAGNNSATLALEILEQDWEKGLDLFLEMLAEPQVRPEELETERRKQLAEIQVEQDNPMAIARDLLRQLLYPEHPYGRNLLGTPESLHRITPADIEAHARSYYLNTGMIFGFSGGLPPSVWEERVASRLAAFPTLQASPPSPALPALEAPVRLEKTVAKTQAVIQLGFRTVPCTHPHEVPLDILDEALSDLGSRLFIRIREELGLAYFVGTTQFKGLKAGHFVFYVGTDPAKRSLIEEALLDEIRKLVREGLTKEEFQRARAKLISQQKIMSQNPSRVLYAAALHELSGAGYDADRRRLEQLEKIQLAEANEMAKLYLDAPGYAVVTVSPR
jgi:zinc protease